MADDPWHVVKNEISTTLAEVERLHAAASGLSGPAARPQLEKLESCLTAAELDLQDLEETISIVEAERARFPIADAELDARVGVAKRLGVELEHVTIRSVRPGSCGRCLGVSRRPKNRGKCCPDCVGRLVCGV